METDKFQGFTWQLEQQRVEDTYENSKDLEQV